MYRKLPRSQMPVFFRVLTLLCTSRGRTSHTSSARPRSQRPGRALPPSRQGAAGNPADRKGRSKRPPRAPAPEQRALHRGKERELAPCLVFPVFWAPRRAVFPCFRALPPLTVRSVFSCFRVLADPPPQTPQGADDVLRRLRHGHPGQTGASHTLGKQQLVIGGFQAKRQQQRLESAQHSQIMPGGGDIGGVAGGTGDEGAGEKAIRPRGGKKGEGGGVGGSGGSGGGGSVNGGSGGSDGGLGGMGGGEV